MVDGVREFRGGVLRVVVFSIRGVRARVLDVDVDEFVVGGVVDVDGGEFGGDDVIDSDLVGVLECGGEENRGSYRFRRGFGREERLKIIEE